MISTNPRGDYDIVPTGVEDSLPIMSESQLIEGLLAGNEQAFRVLVETYQEKVFNTCLGFIKNAEDADDLAQEVFIEVFKSIHKFRMKSSLTTWIYRISVNKSLELLRARKRQKRFGIFSTIFESENQQAVEPADYRHPGIIAENQERSIILFRAMDKLPQNQNTAYTLHKMEGRAMKKLPV